MRNQYDNRDAMDLDTTGGYYMRHVSAMTAEGLDTPSAIAAELGHRDRVIAKQSARIKELEMAVADALADIGPGNGDALLSLSVAAQGGPAADRPEFTVGFGPDGATILKDGQPMTFYGTLEALQNA